VHPHPNIRGQEFSHHLAELAREVLETLAAHQEENQGQIRHRIYDFRADMHIPCRYEATMIVLKWLATREHLGSDAVLAEADALTASISNTEFWISSEVHYPQKEKS
jgi:hypothetical protein